MPPSERIQKIVSAAGVASRRKAERLILQGRITVNGTIVNKLGAKADIAKDHIKVDGKLIRISPRRVYLLLNKPKGVISAVADPEGRAKVTDLVKAGERVFPVGRLDYNSEGLILLTNDGEFAKVVNSAEGRLPKVYDVKVRSTPNEEVLDRLRAGYRLPDGTHLRRCKIQLRQKANNSWLEVTLNQGKNRQIRRMFAAVGHPVMKLRRRRIGFLTDKGLPPGHSRSLSMREVERIKRIGQIDRDKKVHRNATINK